MINKEFSATLHNTTIQLHFLPASKITVYSHFALYDKDVQNEALFSDTFAVILSLQPAANCNQKQLYVYIDLFLVINTVAMVQFHPWYNLVFSDVLYSLSSITIQRTKKSTKLYHGQN